jgi:Peptidase A4 family
MLVAAATIAGSPVSASAATGRETSANWAGYVASAPGVRFHKVTGSWVMPPASCSIGTPANAAIWVGLGGYHSNSRAVEQVGTEVDCTRAGSPQYTAWYELLPAGSVTIPLAVHPGDHVTASVAVTGHRVRMRLRDDTTNATFSKSLKAHRTDVRSADWILEAPSLCDDSGVCEVSQLANFGTTAFSGATAKAHSGHAGPIADPAWAATAIDLVPGAAPGGGGSGPGRSVGIGASASAVTGELAGAGNAFSVSYQSPAPPAPGSPGGAPVPSPAAP